MCVVHIVGKVAAADLTPSQAISLGGGQVFTRLTVGPGRAQGLLMFGLAESRIDVIREGKTLTCTGRWPGPSPPDSSTPRR